MCFGGNVSAVHGIRQFPKALKYTYFPRKKKMAHNFKINMKTIGEKRAYDRHSFSADVVFSYFNKNHPYFAQTMNLGLGGMCFNSRLFLQPGATVIIRLKKVLPNPSGNGSCEGLRSVTLAEVKWCSEVPGDEGSHYAAGVKYFEPAY